MPARAQLSPTGPIELWLVPLGAAHETPERLACLSEEERSRADGMGHADVRRRYAVGRAALRLLLGGRLGVAAQGLRFEYGERGKPRLCGSELAFNLSHSGDLALIGIADEGELGVDLEQIRPSRRPDRLARAVLGDSERRIAADSGTEPEVEWLYRRWTAKEATAKALGLGLTLSPRRIEVADAGEDRGTATVSPAPDRPLPQGSEPIEIRWLPPLDGFVGALAAAGAWSESRAPSRLNWGALGL